MLANPELHLVFETLGYSTGFGLYRWTRGARGDFLSTEQRWVTIAAAAVGGLVGSRLLAVLEQAPLRGFHWSDVFAMAGGKTIVGGLLGGWLAVELAKLLLHINSRTGDVYAAPLCVGIAIGRIGCFFAGLADDTYGTATSLPWGVDFGDGVRRHPTQLYEMIFLAALAWALWRWNRREHVQGRVFRVFLASYLGWRFLVDFIKPEPVWMGLGVIQWACLAGLGALALGEISGGKANPGYDQKVRSHG
jgi:prolipoprotein diacylglyceryltransferase